MDKYLPAPIGKPKKPRKPRAPKTPKPKKEKAPPKPKPPPKPKMPNPTFKSNAEFHAYLESLTHPQLKKVATALVSATKKLVTVDKKASREELLEEMKQTFRYSDVEEDIILPNVGVDKNTLPTEKVRVPKVKQPDRVEPLNEEDYPTQSEISDERTRRQL